MKGTSAEPRGLDFQRLLSSTQRLYGRTDDLNALLDLIAQTLVELLEEIAPHHADATHLMGAAGLLSRSEGERIFRPLRLKGRPDPEELRSFVEHVGPGDSDRPTGLMGWSVARRVAAMRHGREWFVAERDDERDGWAPLRPATSTEIEEMRNASIAAYPSVRSQLAVPILDPEIRGQARPRDAIGIINVESDELLSRRFAEFMIGFSASVGYPLRSAARLRDLKRLATRLAGPMSRGALAQALLGATLPYLPGRCRHGLVALRTAPAETHCVVEAMTPEGLDDEQLETYRAGRFDLCSQLGIWQDAFRAGRTIYVPDVTRMVREQAPPLWGDSQSSIAIPLVSRSAREVMGMLVLESGEASYAFSSQDKGFFEMVVSMAAVAAASLEEARLEYAEAVRIPALLERQKRSHLAEIPEDQIVRINAICRSLVKNGFSFPRAAEECRLTVHILREYTSRSPRIIDIETLRTLAARREDALRAVVDASPWDQD